MNEIQKQIYAYLLKEIDSGALKLNERIPTEIELGKMFNTNRINAHHAIKALEESGIVKGGLGRSQGKTVQRIPSLYTLGELQQAATRRVCVLNRSKIQHRHIHWNNLIIAPLEHGLMEKNIQLVYRDVNDIDTIDEARGILSELVREGVNAILLICDGENPEDFFSDPEMFFGFHDNVIIFDRGNTAWHNWPYTLVSIDVFDEGVIAGEYLTRKGYNNILFATGMFHGKKDMSWWGKQRWRGLHYSVMRESDGRSNVEQLNYGFLDREADTEFIEAVKKTKEQAGSAIVASNDRLAVKMIELCDNLGIKVPEDLAILSFDDDPEFREYNLTTIAPSLERIGSRLAQIITNSIDKNSDGEKFCVRIKSRLITRGTA